MTDHDRTDDADGQAGGSPGPHRLHPAVIATAIALPVALIVGIIVAAVLVSGTSDGQDDGPVAVSGSVPAPDGGSQACTDLLAALPDRMGSYSRARLAEPAPDGAAAWRLDPQDKTGSPGENLPIIMRCGLERPPEFRQGTRLDQVDDVQWFQVTNETVGDALSTWYAVDRPVYIALTLPGGSGSAPIQKLSSAISQTLPAQDIDPAPYRAPDGD